MDVEIVQRARTGDSHALEEIYNDTRKMVYFTALGIVRNENDAEDVVQDTYIKVFQNIARLQDEKAFISWLKTIVVNVSKNNLKKRKPMLFQNDEEEDAVLGSIEEVGEDFLPQEYVDQAEKREIIKSMIENLPDAQRTAVMLYYFDELPLSEVSKVMETTEGTTKSRLNYARKQIRAKVDEQEKKGNKLYAGVPMLTRILHLVSQNYDLPAETANHILTNSLQAASIAAGTAASSAAAGPEAANQAAIASQASASSAAGTAAKTSAAKGILAKIAGMSAQTKLIALIAAGVVVVGSGTGAVLAVKYHNDAARASVSQQVKPLTEQEKKIQNIADHAPDYLNRSFKLISDQIGTGTADETMSAYTFEDGDFSVHTSGDTKLVDDIEVSGKFSMCGVREGAPKEQAIEKMNTIKSVIQCGDSINCLNGDYFYRAVLNTDAEGNKTVRHIFCSVNKDFYFQSYEAPGVTEQEAFILYYKYYQNQQAEYPYGQTVYFADLNHDGISEMLMGYGMMEYPFQLLTVSEGKVTELGTISDLVGTGNRSTYLYSEGGKDYIFSTVEPFTVPPAGFANLDYSVYFYDEKYIQTVTYQEDRALYSHLTNKEAEKKETEKIQKIDDKLAVLKKKSRLLCTYGKDGFEYTPSDPFPSYVFQAASSASPSSSARPSESSKPVQTQPDNSAFAKKLTGGWNWEGSGVDGGFVVYMQFYSDGTCCFEHTEKIPYDDKPMSEARFVSEEYRGTYQILGDNTISFKGTYQETSPVKYFPNRVNACEAKFKIQWTLKNDRGQDFVFSYGSEGPKGMGLTLAGGSSPFDLMDAISQKAGDTFYFLGD